MSRARARQRRFAGLRRGGRRGFNLIELLMALSISSVLLTATMASLDASFTAYQTTTEMASTHTIGHLAPPTGSVRDSAAALNDTT